MASVQYPVPSQGVLRETFVGKQLEDIDPPAHILDLAVVKRNCQLMLSTIEKLNLAFRAHVKTHKV